jgi:uncharacterized caspase-like protein
MRPILIAAAAALLVVSAEPATAQRESRLGLVIGNAAYSGADAALKNPVNDAREVAAALKEVGFAVTLVENADHAAMRRAIREFEDELRHRKGVSFLYFAGHGVQLEGRNYLMPAGAGLVSEVEVRARTVDANELVERLRGTGSRLNIVVLDACRNNPLYKPVILTRGLFSHVGLARVQPASGTVVAFSTEPGRVASDGSAGRGLYAKYLVQYIRTPGVTLDELFKRVREAVVEETKGAQTPVEFSTLRGGDFYFVPPPAAR